jgi:sulfate/thiosulfate transport system substrate-binding protein
MSSLKDVASSRLLVVSLLAVALAGCGKKGSSSAEQGASSLLVAAYDPARTVVVEANKAFTQEHAGAAVRESFGGSGKQARAIVDGLAADIAVLALEEDLQALVEAKLVKPDWAAARQGALAPFTSTVVFLVRKGNPKGIRDWGDLARADVALVAPNPKSSSAAKLTYLAAWGWATRQPNGSEASAEALVRALYTKAVVLDATARAATTTFVQNGIGDVLVTWENEAYLARDESKGAAIEVVAPSVSIVAEPAVAVVDANVDKHGTRALAEAYVAKLATPELQEVAARAHFRPRNEKVREAHRAELAEIPLFTVAEVTGSWAEAKRRHFGQGALLDTILESRR